MKLTYLSDKLTNFSKFIQQLWSVKHKALGQSSADGWNQYTSINKMWWTVLRNHGFAAIDTKVYGACLVF